MWTEMELTGSLAGGWRAGPHSALTSGRTEAGPDGTLASVEDAAGLDGTATSDSGRAGSFDTQELTELSDSLAVPSRGKTPPPAPSAWPRARPCA